MSQNYQNGDITWNTYSGVFKAFDKDGNEIKFPTEDTGYQVKLDVQGILNLYEENKRLKRIEELRIAQIENLKQENKELKEEKQAIKSYLGIEAKTILERLEELDEWKHDDKLLLWKYRSALEEIKEIANDNNFCASYACPPMFKILDKINEVSND